VKRKLNVGVIGLGRLGKVYARYFAYQIPNARLAAIADIDPAAVESTARELDVEAAFTNYHDLLDGKKVDAVAIITSTKMHHEVVIAAAKAGKAIFCEKPLSISLEESNEMLKVIDQTKVFFHMGFMRRYDPGYAAAKKKIEDGAIGTAVVFKSSSRDPFRPALEYAHPANSGGLILDMGIHDFDLARWFMGEVKSVYSIGGTLAYPEMKPIGDIDNAIVSLYFTSGALGSVDLSRNGTYGYDIRTEILGTNGSVQIGYLRETPILLMKKEGIIHDAVPYFFERFERAYLAQLKSFVETYLEGKEPAITCADGIAALKIALTATRSFHENRPLAVADND
jgi:inositol 2-dehydrogenase